MSRDPVEVIARTLLYEGYLLYPYRPSALKNRLRFNFGVLYPQGDREVQAGAEAWQMQTQCPVRGSATTTLDVSVRFLQLVARRSDCGESRGWQEAVEREVRAPGTALDNLQMPLRVPFHFEEGEDTEGAKDPADPTSEVVIRRREAICGELEVEAERLGDDAFKVTVRVSNVTPVEAVRERVREDALMTAFISTHTVLEVRGGELVSLLDPPEPLREIVSGCCNVGTWPVLVGDETRRDRMLSSPIILYDYPQIAPESAGDLFDGTEIDEILALRVMTMTDEEKREARGADERARQIVDRTDGLPLDHMQKLHGAIRGLRPVTGSRS